MFLFVKPQGQKPLQADLAYEANATYRYFGAPGSTAKTIKIATLEPGAYHLGVKQAQLVQRQLDSGKGNRFDYLNRQLLSTDYSLTIDWQ